MEERSTDAPEITVIVPVHDVGPYIGECIASLRRQTFADFEAILVDDGSTDDSGELCERAAVADPRFRVIHQECRGMSGARNTGLDAASGRHIFFMDSDDVIHAETLATLLSISRERGADLVSSPMKRVREIPADEPFPADAVRELEPREAIRLVLYQQLGDNSLCGNLYDARLWDGLRLREGILYEDLDIFYRVMARARKVAQLTEPLYYYRVRHGSILSGFTPRRTDVLDVTDRIVEWARGENSELTDAARTRRVYAYINILGIMHATGNVIADADARCRRIISEEGRYCRKLPEAKRSLKAAMTILRLAGWRLFVSLLAVAYRRHPERR